VLVLAQNEASSLNHSFIGTEHILLALIEEGDGVAARALEALGISAEFVRERVKRIHESAGMPGTSPSGSPPFTPRAKKVLELSLREALQRNHSYIGTEHLLLGVVREGEGEAATVLTSMGVDLSQVRQTVILLMSGQTGEASLGVVGAAEPIISHIGRVSSHETVPLCPQCHGALGDVARVKPEWIQSGAEDASRPLLVDVVYCAQCGATLQMFKPDVDGRQSPRNTMRGGRVATSARVGVPGEASGNRRRFPDDVSPSEGAIPDDDLIKVDLVHKEQQLTGVVGEEPIDLLLDVPCHAGEVRGNFAGHDLVASWQLGDNYYEHPDVSGTASGTFAGQAFELLGVFHLDSNYAIEAAEISGEIGGEPIAVNLQPATGGLSPTRTVAIDGTFAGTEFSIFSTISGDLTSGHVRGVVDGHALRLDASKEQKDGSVRVTGTYGGPPAILALAVGTFLYFI
jgi:hypothetical protein